MSKSYIYRRKLSQSKLIQLNIDLSTDILTKMA